MKAGHKTTEFYMAIVGTVIPVVNAHFGLNIDPVSIASIVGLIASYVIGRTVAKKGA